MAAAPSPLPGAGVSPPGGAPCPESTPGAAASGWRPGGGSKACRPWRNSACGGYTRHFYSGPVGAVSAASPRPGSAVAARPNSLRSGAASGPPPPCPEPGKMLPPAGGKRPGGGALLPAVGGDEHPPRAGGAVALSRGGKSSAPGSLAAQGHPPRGGFAGRAAGDDASP